MYFIYNLHYEILLHACIQAEQRVTMACGAILIIAFPVVRNTLFILSESTVVLYVGMAQKQWLPVHSIASDKLKSLVIYTDKF